MPTPITFSDIEGDGQGSSVELVEEGSGGFVFENFTEVVDGLGEGEGLFVAEIRK